MTTERLPPYDIDAEEAVNGSLLIDGQAIYVIVSKLTPDDFYHVPNRLIYGACLSLFSQNKAINQITVAQELDRQAKLETCGGAAYLSHLISECPTSQDIEHYAEIVYRLSQYRKLWDAGERIIAIASQQSNDLEATLSQANQILYEANYDKSGGETSKSLKQCLKDLMDVPMGEEPQSNVLSQIDTGFKSLDEFLCGLKNQDLIILAGRPGMGKTTLAMNIAKNVVTRTGKNVFVFSLEMARDELVFRLLSGEAGLPYEVLRGYYIRRLNQLSQKEEVRLLDSCGILTDTNVGRLEIDDTARLTISDIRLRLKRAMHNFPVNLVIIDHLGLIDAGRRFENRTNEVSFISRQLKALAKENNIPVLAISQLNRGTEYTADKRPQLRDLRDSGSIEQDADVVLLIYQEELIWRDKKDEWQNAHPSRSWPPPAEIIIAKQRNGPTGTIKLRFKAQFTTFEEIRYD